MSSAAVVPASNILQSSPASDHKDDGDQVEGEENLKRTESGASIGFLGDQSAIPSVVWRKQNAKLCDMELLKCLSFWIVWLAIAGTLSYLKLAYDPLT